VSGTAEPNSFTLTPSLSHEEWCELVAAAVDAIDRGGLEKIVLARDVVVDADRPLVVPAILARLRALYPSCTTFSMDGFVGASPELLVSRLGHTIASHPLAGTIPHRGDPQADERAAAALLESPKEIAEHQLVVDAVAAELRPLCCQLSVPLRPSIVSRRNVSHLGTLVAGRLETPAPGALELARRLHPTPAVGGTPTRAALDWLARHERLERGRYAGPVGWVDGNGDGLFSVGIRSAEVSGERARLFAGVGIVEGSEPERELAETQLKLQALLAAIVRP
jgi:menaquinone-specific isochorismate synthase